MFFGIPQRYTVDIYGFYFEEYIPGYLTPAESKMACPDSGAGKQYPQLCPWGSIFEICESSIKCSGSSNRFNLFV